MKWRKTNTIQKLVNLIPNRCQHVNTYGVKMYTSNCSIISIDLNQWSNYQFPRCVIFANGKTRFRAAGTFPEKAGSTETQMKTLLRTFCSHRNDISRYRLSILNFMTSYRNYLIFQAFVRLARCNSNIS